MNPLNPFKDIRSDYIEKYYIFVKADLRLASVCHDIYEGIYKGVTSKPFKKEEIDRYNDLNPQADDPIRVKTIKHYLKIIKDIENIAKNIEDIDVNPERGSLDLAKDLLYTLSINLNPLFNAVQDLNKNTADVLYLIDPIFTTLLPRLQFAKQALENGQAWIEEFKTTNAQALLHMRPIRLTGLSLVSQWFKLLPILIDELRELFERGDIKIDRDLGSPALKKAIEKYEKQLRNLISDRQFTKFTGAFKIIEFLLIDSSAIIKSGADFTSVTASRADELLERIHYNLIPQLISEIEQTEEGLGWENNCLVNAAEAPLEKLLNALTQHINSLKSTAKTLQNVNQDKIQTALNIVIVAPVTNLIKTTVNVISPDNKIIENTSNTTANNPAPSTTLRDEQFNQRLYLARYWRLNEVVDDSAYRHEKRAAEAFFDKIDELSQHRYRANELSLLPGSTRTSLGQNYRVFQEHVDPKLDLLIVRGLNNSHPIDTTRGLTDGLNEVGLFTLISNNLLKPAIRWIYFLPIVYAGFYYNSELRLISSHKTAILDHIDQVHAQNIAIAKQIKSRDPALEHESEKALSERIKFQHLSSMEPILAPDRDHNRIRDSIEKARANKLTTTEEIKRHHSKTIDVEDAPLVELQVNKRHQDLFARLNSLHLSSTIQDFYTKTVLPKLKEYLDEPTFNGVFANWSRDLDSNALTLLPNSVRYQNTETVMMYKTFINALFHLQACLDRLEKLDNRDRPSWFAYQKGIDTTEFLHAVLWDGLKAIFALQSVANNPLLTNLKHDLFNQLNGALSDIPILRTWIQNQTNADPEKPPVDIFLAWKQRQNMKQRMLRNQETPDYIRATLLPIAPTATLTINKSVKPTGCGLIRMTIDPESCTPLSLKSLLKNRHAYILYGSQLYYISKNFVAEKVNSTEITQLNDIFKRVGETCVTASKQDLKKINSLTGRTKLKDPLTQSIVNRLIELKTQYNTDTNHQLSAEQIQTEITGLAEEFFTGIKNTLTHICKELHQNENALTQNENKAIDDWITLLKTSPSLNEIVKPTTTHIGKLISGIDPLLKLIHSAGPVMVEEAAKNMPGIIRQINLLHATLGAEVISIADNAEFNGGINPGELTESLNRMLDAAKQKVIDALPIVETIPANQQQRKTQLQLKFDASIDHTLLKLRIQNENARLTHIKEAADILMNTMDAALLAFEELRAFTVNLTVPFDDEMQRFCAIYQIIQPYLKDIGEDNYLDVSDAASLTKMIKNINTDLVGEKFDSLWVKKLENARVEETRSNTRIVYLNTKLNEQIQYDEYRRKIHIIDIFIEDKFSEEKAALQKYAPLYISLIQTQMHKNPYLLDALSANADPYIECGLLKTPKDPYLYSEEQLRALLKNKPAYLLFKDMLYYVDINYHVIPLDFKENTDIKKTTQLKELFTNKRQTASVQHLKKITSLTDHFHSALIAALEQAKEHYAYSFDSLLYLNRQDTLLMREQSDIEGCDIYFKSTLPDNIEKFKNSYVFVNNKQLFYIETDGTKKAVTITDMKILSDNIHALNSKNQSKIHLSDIEISKLIPSKEGRTTSEKNKQLDENPCLKKKAAYLTEMSESIDRLSAKYSKNLQSLMDPTLFKTERIWVKKLLLKRQHQCHNYDRMITIYSVLLDLEDYIKNNDATNTNKLNVITEIKNILSAEGPADRCLENLGDYLITHEHKHIFSKQPERGFIATMKWVYAQFMTYKPQHDETRLKMYQTMGPFGQTYIALDEMERSLLKNPNQFTDKLEQVTLLKRIMNCTEVPQKNRLEGVAEHIVSPEMQAIMLNNSSHSFLTWFNYLISSITGWTQQEDKLLAAVYEPLGSFVKTSLLLQQMQHYLEHESWFKNEEQIDTIKTLREILNPREVTSTQDLRYRVLIHYVLNNKGRCKDILSKAPDSTYLEKLNHFFSMLVGYKNKHQRLYRELNTQLKAHGLFGLQPVLVPVVDPIDNTNENNRAIRSDP